MEKEDVAEESVTEEPLCIHFLSVTVQEMPVAEVSAASHPAIWSTRTKQR